MYGRSQRYIRCRFSVRGTPAGSRLCATTAVATWCASMDVPNAIDVAAGTVSTTTADAAIVSARAKSAVAGDMQAAKS